MSDFRNKPKTPGDVILEHHGVKGMRWGVRNEDDSGGGRSSKTPQELAEHNAQTKDYMAAARKTQQPRSLAEAQANWAKSQDKFAAKFEPIGSPKSAPVKTSGGMIEAQGPPKQPRLTPGQKKALIFAGGAVVAIGGAYALKRSGVNFNVVDTAMEKSHLQLAGKPIKPNAFQSFVGHSQSKTWMGSTGYLTDKAFARPEFELPAGNTFFRLTTRAETEFGPVNYVTHSLDDFNRYVAGFRHELGLNPDLHKVSFTSTKPIKVPDLNTVLGTLKGVLEEEAKDPSSFYHGMSFSSHNVALEYNSMSGGSWDAGAGKKLISALKSKGFGALVDEMDAGVIGETPLVFFGTDSATPKTSVPFSSKAVKQAEAMLKEISNPPGRKP